MGRKFKINGAHRRRALAAGVGLAACAWAMVAEAQLVSPPETVWGEVYEHPDGLQIGGIELLAGLIIALTILLAACSFLAYQKRLMGPRAAGGPELRRLRRQLVFCAFVATPLLGLATIILGGPHLLFGVEVALLGVSLSVLSLLVATASLVLEPT